MYGLDQEEMEVLRQIFSEVKNLEEVVLYGSRAKEITSLSLILTLR